MATASNKDTIYIDIDDEITTIIDKVRSSQGKIVALVLPKRASVFQSVVNMKLLKRSAEEAKKHLVLITSEASLMPLAGAVGLHVAKTPQSKPEIPAGPQTSADASDAAQESVTLEDEPVATDGYTAENAGNRPVGELAGGSAAVAGGLAGVETLDLPDDEDIVTDTPGPAAAKPKKGTNKKLKIPNFNKFRTRLVLGGLFLVLLVFGLYIALSVLPKATIAIATNANDVNVDLTLTLDTTAETLNTSEMIVPAKTEQEQKTTSEQVPATGEKNNGDRANGTITMQAKKCGGNPFDFPSAVPAGTGVSTNDLTFITQESANFGGDGVDSSGCYLYSSGDVAIKSQSPGEKYNVSNATFAVAGRPDVTATGSASGGTDDIVKVVSQSDVDAAKDKLAKADADSIKRELEQELQQDGLYPIPDTFKASDPIITTSSNVGDRADNVTVTAAITYTMYGAKQSDLETLLKNDINDQVDTSKQAIQDNGLDSAEIKVLNASGDKDEISLKTTAVVGPHIDVNKLKSEAAGKKSGDVKGLIGTQPGVTGVDVHLSPFWVSSIPKNTSKITITVDKAAKTSHDGQK